MYNNTESCDRIIEEKRCGRDFHGKAFKEKNKGVWTGKWICSHCYQLLKKYGTTDEKILNKIRLRNRAPSEEICYKCDDKAWINERDINGIGTGKYICKYHYYSDYNKRPNCGNNIIKSLSKIRNGTIDLDDSIIKGLHVEIAVANVRKLEVLSILEDNFRLKFDLSIDKELGRIDVKSIIPNELEIWKIGLLKFHNFDNILITCMDMDRKNIDRVYIIPKKEFTANSIGIVKNPKNLPWYEKYRVSNEPYNCEYQKVDIYAELNKRIRKTSIFARQYTRRA